MAPIQTLSTSEDRQSGARTDMQRDYVLGYHVYAAGYWAGGRLQRRRWLPQVLLELLELLRWL